jgi:hypothetical protein
MNWADRREWVREKSAVFAAHLAPVCEHVGRSQEELAQELAERGYGGMLFGMLFEDLASRGLTPNGRNLIDDYLQRRRWRESASGRRYLRQLRDSVLSLYEVIAVSPGRHCDLRVANYHRQCSRTRTTLPSSRALTVGSLIARPVAPARLPHTSVKVRAWGEWLLSGGANPA